jgi:sulfoxide reductase catalytic subunit YedY
MYIKRHSGWEMPERLATPESVFLNRRALLGGAAGLAATSLVGVEGAFAAADPTSGLYPAARNEAYTLDRPLTAEKFSADYNNFYEFGTSKTVLPAANALKTRPWTLKIDGLVEMLRPYGVLEMARTGRVAMSRGAAAPGTAVTDAPESKEGEFDSGVSLSV